MDSNGNNDGELFSVYQFFADGSQSKELELETDKHAMTRALSLITSIGARLGTTKRVIIVDAWDNICLEWIHGKGITFPLGFHTREIKEDSDDGTTGAA